MCELAFNVTGEGFEPPESAVFWRVRKLKPGGRGTPEVMFGADGAPLMIPVDTDLAEFRQQVKGEPGRYRLDPVDESQRPCEGGTPSYLQLTDEAMAAAEASAAPVPQYDIVKELVRANTEMVLSITEKFSAVMDSAATLLRAADGAGLPARQPAQVLPSPATDVSEDDDNDEDEDDEDEIDGPGAELSALLKQVMPLIQMAVAQKLGKKQPKQAAPPSAAEPRNANIPQPEAEMPEEPAAAADPPTLTPTAMAHFMAVQQKLTAEESRLAQQVAADLSPAEARVWIDQLCKLSVDDAVAAVRKALAQGGAS